MKNEAEYINLHNLAGLGARANRKTYFSQGLPFKGHFKGGDTLNTITAKNIVISPYFLVWKFCGKAQFRHSFRMRKLCLSTKFPHQEIR